MVLLPSLANDDPVHTVKLLEDKDRTGCEITGPNRTTRWWFDKEHDGPQVEILTETGSPRMHDLRVREFTANNR